MLHNEDFQINPLLTFYGGSLMFCAAQLTELRGVGWGESRRKAPLIGFNYQIEAGSMGSTKMNRQGNSNLVSQGQPGPSKGMQATPTRTPWPA